VSGALVKHGLMLARRLPGFMDSYVVRGFIF
jgi:hypothetical protein